MDKHGCGPSWFFAILGLLGFAVGYLLWSGYFTLEQGVGALIMLMAIMKLSWIVGPMLGKKK